MHTCLQGGLKWGDDGTLKQTFIIGEEGANSTVTDDVLFRAAEKLGIDARPMSSQQQLSEDRKLVFNFFGDSNTASATSTTSTTNANANEVEATGWRIDSYVMPTITTQQSQNQTGSLKTNKKNNIDSESAIIESNEPLFDICELLSIAKLFHRTE